VTDSNEFNYAIESLEQHDRATFCCGVEALDIYFQRQAGQDARKYVAASFVLIDKSIDRIAGYYTLSALSIAAGELPPEIKQKLKLPKYPILPATLLGRLAVDRNDRGRGLGELLLMDALRRAWRSKIASMAVIVDAKDESARSFYERYQLTQFPNYPNRLFLPMAAIAKLTTIL
jgi:GNAT superfamily N-acetyltransferase